MSCPLGVRFWKHIDAKTNVPSNKFKFTNLSVEKKYYLVTTFQVENTQKLVGLN